MRSSRWSGTVRLMHTRSLWKASGAAIAVLTLVGCGTTDGQGLVGETPRAPTSTSPGQGSAPPATPSTFSSNPPASPATTSDRSVLTVGRLTLRAPTGWRVTAADGRGDFAISTTGCVADDTVWGSRCPAVLVLTADEPGLGGAGIGIGSEGQSPYDPAHPYSPSSGVLPCPHYPNSAAKPGASRHSFVPVAGRTADHVVWQFACTTISTGAHLGSFEQRDWYLPASRVLVVDQYQTQGLAATLENATLH